MNLKSLLFICMLFMGAQLNCADSPIFQLIENKTNLSEREIIEELNAAYYIDYGEGNIVNNCNVIRQKDSATPLHLALRKRYINVITWLINHHIDLNAYDNKGHTPLYIALFEINNTEIAQLLINGGANIDAADPSYQWTLLHTAVEQDRIDIIRFLIQKNANINIQNNVGDTPLHLAAKKNSKNIIDLLVQHHADIDIQNYAYQTATNILKEKNPHLPVPQSLQSKQNPQPNQQPLAKKLNLPPSSSWFSTLCVLSGLGIIGYDIHQTNKLKKEQTDNAVTEPFLILKNPLKVTKETIETKEKEEKETIQEEVITPKPVLHHSRQRPLKPVAHPTIEAEKTDRFAFIKNLPKNLHDRIKPQYKASKEQGKTWFKDLKQNPREHKKLAAAATLFTLALVKNLVPGLKDL